MVKLGKLGPEQNGLISYARNMACVIMAAITGTTILVTYL